MRPLRAVTLDAYGTVFDFEGALRTRAVRRILELAGLPEQCPERFADRWGVNFHAIYEEFGRSWRRDGGSGGAFKTVADITAEALEVTYRQHGVELDPRPGTEIWIEHLLGVEVFPEVPAVLEALRGRVKLAMLSDTDERIIAPALGRFAGAFSFVLTSEAVQAYKYDPEAAVFRQALARLDLAPEEVLHAGDSAADVTGAKTAGMRAAWVNRAGRRLPAACPRPDWELPDLSPIPALLEGAG